MSQISVLKAMADESRLRILCLLMEDSLCVCEIEALLGLLQSNVSRHLNKLTTSHMVKFYKSNKYIYYELNREWLVENAHFIFEALEREKQTNFIVQEDVARLKIYKTGETDLADEGLQKLCWHKSGEKCNSADGEV